MADSPAERARRARRHRKGDHSLCDPERRCELVEQTATREAVAGTEALPDGGYGPRGAALRVAMASAELGPMHRLLVDEAARMADRLDRLHAALENKGTWLRHETADGGEIVIQVDGVLAEARQTAATLKALVAEIRAALPKPDTKPSTGRAKQEGGLADLIVLAGGR
ncbi:MAG: hypothetical protein AB7G23_20280 [Vicinamibacterales bacterium]